MTDRPNLSKGSPAATPAKPAPPRLVIYTSILLLVSGVMAVLASASLYTSTGKSFLHDSVRDSLSDQMSTKVDDIRKAGPSGGERGTQLTALKNQAKSLKGASNADLTTTSASIKSRIDDLTPGASKNGKTLLGDLDKQANDVNKIDSTVSTQQKGVLIQSIIVLAALAIAAGSAYRGRYWARWAVLGLWVLATLTGSVSGISYVLSVGANIPGLFKAPAFVAGLSLVAAVVLVNLRPSIAYYALTKPERGARPQRRGLFSPPPPRGPQGPSTPPAGDTTTAAASDRIRTKQRSSDAAVAKGAELARSRAKASKSRRTGA